MIKEKSTAKVLGALWAIPTPKTTVTRPAEVITIVLKEEGRLFFTSSPIMVPSTTESAFINVTIMVES